MAPIRSNNSSSSFQQGSPHFDFLTSGSSHGGDASPATDESKEQRDSAQDQSPSRGRMLSKKSPSSSSLTASITASMPMFPLKRGTSLIPSEPHIASSDLRKGSIPPSMLQSPTSRDGRESASNSKRFLPSDLNRMVMILTAELRKCTILFINIKVNVNLVTSPVSADRSFSESISYKKVKSLPFIARSVEEKKGDEEVLAALQKCMEITSTTLTENGGQIRQFIHDDKGTVCIGTIGLRGSTTEDNSAAAVEAARSIIAQLQDAGLDASIGVASGKAFCGLVGSSVRHEYAVMGPSVNLSARLMCAAKMGTILCDQKTMETDRRHRYVAKSAIIAKGFDAPVSIFRPLTTNVQGRSGAPGSSRVPRGRSRSPSPTRIKGIPSNSSLSSLMALAPHNRSNSKNSSSSPGHDTVNNSDDESCASTEDAFGMAFDSGLFGRASVLAKIYYFFSPDDAPFSRLNSRDDCMKKFVATVEMPTGFKGESDAPKVFSPLKMKLIIVSGPYGIGKSSVLRTIYQKVHVTSSPITSGSARFKYMTQANSYNKTTPFYVWKKILTHLLAALHFNVNKMSENDLTFSKVAYLSPVPEHKHLAVSSAAAVPPIEYFKRATINHSSKLLRSGKKKSIIAGNIHHLIKLLDPSLREMEPLLFNGFLSRLDDLLYYYDIDL